MVAKYIIAVLLVVVFSYLMGSVNSAIIISKIMGENIKEHGSGNAGMTNMLRTFGIKAAVLTALGDLAKGIIAVLVSRHLIFPCFGITAFDAGYLAGLFVMLGHIFPVFFGFKGGKGVMASLGVMLVLDPVVFVGILTVGLIAIFITKTVSVGSMLGAICLPIFTFIHRYLQGVPFWYDTILCIIISSIVIFMHHDNIKRLLAGEENKFGKKNK